MTENSKFWRGALCGALVMLVIAAAGTAVWGFAESRNSNTDAADEDIQKKIKQIDSLISESYLYEDKIDSEKLREGQLSGYVDALEDPYSVYYDEEATNDLLESTEGEYSGIGAVLSQNTDTMLITLVTIYKGSPAEEAGLKDGDILYKVNGEDITTQTVTEVVTQIKGKEGSDVELTVLRGETKEEVTVTATRRTIEVETVTWEMKENNIGYIKVTEFDKVTVDQYQTALDELTAQGMEGLVVDLRSNPGGNLTTVCEMLDLMLPKGTVVYTEDKNGERTTATSDEEHQFTKPMAVLVNQYSASASEIYAGAIQDYKLGQIVGTTTYGKGVVQQIFNLGDGTSLKLTISEYFTPNGRSINGTGIKPDVEVEYEKNEADEEADNQLDKAVEVVKGEID